jgi:hypothetical protein
MKKKLVLSMIVIGALLISGVSLATVRTEANDGQRVGPPNFGPMGGDHCGNPNLFFGSAPTTVSNTVNVAGEGTVQAIDLSIQITHTWVGDIIATLTHDDTATSATVINQIGVPAIGPCGCSGDDIDATLSDFGTGSVEDACTGGVPSISGTLIPDPDALSGFNGEDANGDWTLSVTDAVPTFDSGTFNMWCLSFVQPPTDDDDTSVPAVNSWGVMILVAVFLGASILFLRRRSSESV